MDRLIELGAAPLLLAIGALFSFTAGLLVLTFSTRAEMLRLKDDYYALLEFQDADKSRELMRDMELAIRNIERDSRVTEKDINQLYTILGYCVQKVAVIRYNAFHNVGSDQSFSLALLDNEDTGVVISGIYGRDSSTTYAKPIRNGVSDYVLTDEEEEAIGQARMQYIDMSYYKREK